MFEFENQRLKLALPRVPALCGRGLLLPLEHLMDNPPRDRVSSWSDLLTKELTSLQYIYAYWFQHIIHHPQVAAGYNMYFELATIGRPRNSGHVLISHGLAL